MTVHIFYVYLNESDNYDANLFQIKTVFVKLSLELTISFVIIWKFNQIYIKLIVDDGFCHNSFILN